MSSFVLMNVALRERKNGTQRQKLSAFSSPYFMHLIKHRAKIEKKRKGKDEQQKTKGKCVIAAENSYYMAQYDVCQ